MSDEVYDYLNAPLIEGRIIELTDSPVKNPGEMRDLFMLVEENDGNKDMWRIEIVSLKKKKVDGQIKIGKVLIAGENHDGEKIQMEVSLEEGQEISRRCIRLHQEEDPV